MSGGAFICGMRRFDKHKIVMDKPNNLAAYHEQQKKLSELVRLREEQDKEGLLPSGSNAASPTAPIHDIYLSENAACTRCETYTPWKTPSANRR